MRHLWVIFRHDAFFNRPDDDFLSSFSAQWHKSLLNSFAHFGTIFTSMKDGRGLNALPEDMSQKK